MKMIVLYSVFAALLFVVKHLIAWRALAWERYYEKTSNAVTQSLTGLNGAGDQVSVSKAQMKLARYSLQQEEAEAGWLWWKGVFDRVDWAHSALAGYRNTSLGYFAAKVDGIAATLLAVYYSPEGVFNAVKWLEVWLGK